MAQKSATDIVSKWASRMAAAGPAYTAGINGVTESPMAKAAAKLDKARANYNEAIDSGRMAAALNNTPMSFWKSQAAAASSKLASGATKGSPKMMKAVTALIPVWQQMRTAADGAGDDTVAKFAAAITVLKAAKGAGKAY